MDDDQTAAIQPDATGARAIDDVVPSDEQATDGDAVAKAASDEASAAEPESEQRESDLVDVEAESDAKASALADWFARVREHAPSLLSDEPSHVSTPPVVPQSAAGLEPDAEPSVGSEQKSAAVVEVLSATPDQAQRAIREKDDDAQPPSARPGLMAARADLAAATADESPRPSDTSYPTSLASPVSLPSDPGRLREPASDARLSASGPGQAQAATRPGSARKMEQEPRRDDARARNEPRKRLFTLGSAPAIASAPSLASASSIGDRTAGSTHRPTTNAATFPPPAATTRTTADLSAALGIDDDFVPSAAFPPLLVNDAPRADRSMAPDTASAAAPTPTQSVVRDERPLALGWTWPSLPEDIDFGDDADDVTTTLRARDRWARLVREQESA